MTSNISTVAPNTNGQRHLRFQWWWLLAIVAVVPILASLPGALAVPRTIPRITFVNRATYAIDVDATDAQRDGWVGLGTLERQATTVVNDVINQGRMWIFRFESQGFDGGELRLSETDLVRLGWRVVIPNAVAARLAEEGATPTPPRGY